jgi:hypothetical protein
MYLTKCLYSGHHNSLFQKPVKLFQAERMVYVVWRLELAWIFRNSIPVLGGIFPPSILYNKIRIPFPWVERPRNGADYPSHLEPRLVRVHLTLLPVHLTLLPPRCGFISRYMVFSTATGFDLLPGMWSRYTLQTNIALLKKKLCSKQTKAFLFRTFQAASTHFVLRLTTGP